MGAVIGSLIVIGLFYGYSRDLPDPNSLAKYEPAIVTRLYANNGKLLAEYAKEHRLYLPLDAMPKRLINAFLAAEDKGFYEHDGVDFMSIARAVVTNINNFGKGRAMVGGSTITQQVVKNFLLSNERSFDRKIKEAILAFRMDRIYSKDRILELYLNEIYLGKRSYGVAAAALNYFNKSLDELTIAESAFLAGLPKGPANYDPDKNYDRAKDRRSYVLDRMHVNGFITLEEMQIADDSPINLRKRDKSEVAKADFFAEEVRRNLAGKYGEDVLYKGGLYVKTTVDPALQEKADRALRKSLMDYDRRHGWRGPITYFPNFSEWKSRLVEVEEKTPLYEDHRVGLVELIGKGHARLAFTDGSKGKLPLSQMKWAKKYISETVKGRPVNKVEDVVRVGDVLLVKPLYAKVEKEGEEPKRTGEYALLQIPKVNGALVAMDAHSGRVLAMSGGYSYKGSEFNRATQAMRQPGSAFKPFVYLAGIESGMTPATKLLDAPISIPQGPDKPAWEPQNYSGDFIGSVTMRMGLERSRNAMTVYLANLLGIERIQEIGKRFDVYPDLPPHYATVLGSQETTLIKLVNAYAMLVNGGKRVSPELIERIDNRYGKIIFRRDQRDCENCVFRDSVPPEVQTAPPELPDNRETVVDAASAFQVTHMLTGVVERGTAKRAKVLGVPLGGKTGTTNDSRDAWFIGFSPDLVVGLYIGFDKPKPLGPKETGSSVALPGFVDFMEVALNKEQARPFSMPEGIRMYKVDRWTGRAPRAGVAAKNVIYEAFKFYENPVQQATGVGVSPNQNPANQVNQAPRGNVAVVAPPTRTNRWDYSTGGVRGGNAQAPTQPVNRGWAIPGQPQPPAQPRQQVQPYVPNQRPQPAYQQPSYAERAEQLRRQREARGYYDNGVVGGGRYYNRQQRNDIYTTQPRQPQQQAPSYGTGGLY